VSKKQYKKARKKKYNEMKIGVQKERRESYYCWESISKRD